MVIPKMAARDTRRYLQVLKEEKVTILNQTPTAFYNLMGLELKNPKRELNLRYIIFGGEALAPGRLRDWKSRYPGTKLINMYGITETTVHVTFKEITDIDIETNKSNIGKPIPTLSNYIVDKNLELLPIGAAGELVVGGEGLGRGYLNSPELTGEKFVPNPYRVGERLYRSADLARLSGAGDLEYQGRIDQQIKIRGFRIELGEIENQLLTHEKVKEAVVTARQQHDGEKYLCAYIVGANSFDRTSSLSTELRKYLSKMLPDYMIPAYFVAIDEIPLTANGKLDRKSLPEPTPATGIKYAPPGDELEEKLVEIWTEVIFGRDSPPGSPIGIDDNFFEIGGHSLKAARLTAKIHKEFDVVIQLADFFKIPNIRELSAYIKESAAKDRFVSIKAVENKEYYGLSSVQKRLYILQQLDAESTAYNMPVALTLEGSIDESRIESIFNQLIHRHESLRTSFVMQGGESVQRIHMPGNIGFKIAYFDIGTGPGMQQAVPPGPAARNLLPANDIIQDFIRPFDLSLAPLLRVGLIKLAEQYHLLLLDMHHIVSDGRSLEIFVKEFMTLYSGEVISLPRLQYKDYSQWQKSEYQKKVGKREETYWLEQFSTELPLLNLHTDFPRPHVLDYQGNTLGFELGQEETGSLKQLAKEEGVTLYMLLLAIYYILLSKITGQEDIVIGTPVLGRRHADLQPVIGMFVNTLVLRNYPTREKKFNEFLGELKERTLNAFENQDYQFEDLVERFKKKTLPGRNPVFDVMFVRQDLDKTEIEIPGLKLKEYEYENKTAKFDMTLGFREAGEKLLLFFEYKTRLFKPETIRRFFGYYKEIVMIVPGNREVKLEDIKISHRYSSARPAKQRIEFGF